MNTEGHILVDSFHIDGNELDGLTNKEAFVLGAEWYTFRIDLRSGAAEIKSSVHVRNVDRLLALAKSYHYSSQTEKRDDKRTIITAKKIPPLRLVE